MDRREWDDAVLEVRTSAFGHPLPETSAAPGAEAMARFARTLSSQGLRAAIAVLLQVSGFRCGGIMRFRDGMATFVTHVDRQDPHAAVPDDLADADTYCVKVRDRLGICVIADALDDPRTATHVARAVVRSYCGVPIVDASGEFIGTLCHYNLEPIELGHLDIELLLKAATLIGLADCVPEYGSRC